MPLDCEPNLETGPIAKEAEAAAGFGKSLVANKRPGHCVTGSRVAQGGLMGSRCKGHQPGFIGTSQFPKLVVSLRGGQSSWCDRDETRETWLLWNRSRRQSFVPRAQLFWGMAGTKLFHWQSCQRLCTQGKAGNRYCRPRVLSFFLSFLTEQYSLHSKNLGEDPALQLRLWVPENVRRKLVSQPKNMSLYQGTYLYKEDLM